MHCWYLQKYTFAPILEFLWRVAFGIISIVFDLFFCSLEIQYYFCLQFFIVIVLEIFQLILLVCSLLDFFSHFHLHYDNVLNLNSPHSISNDYLSLCDVFFGHLGIEFVSSQKYILILFDLFFINIISYFHHCYS